MISFSVGVLIAWQKLNQQTCSNWNPNTQLQELYYLLFVNQYEKMFLHSRVSLLSGVLYYLCITLIYSTFIFGGINHLFYIVCYNNAAIHCMTLYFLNTIYSFKLFVLFCLFDSIHGFLYFSIWTVQYWRLFYFLVYFVCNSLCYSLF